jgi:peptide deformylase
MNQAELIERLEQKHIILKRIMLELPEIILVGSDTNVLREKTELVNLEEGISIGKKLNVALQKYREISGIGRGLAAPQIGINKSVADGFLARLLQHEYDHLQGILNIDIAEAKGLSDSLFIDPLKEILRDY